MSALNESIRQYTLSELRKSWHGDLPGWEHFKEAHRRDAVRTSKPVALKYIHHPAVPQSWRIIHGVILMWVWFLALPFTVLIWLLFGFSAWWILVGLFAALFFKSVSREGHCEGIKAGAERSEEFYQELIEQGAFIFEPVTKN